MKRINKQFLVLAIALIISFGTLTACAVAEKSANEPASGSTAHEGSPANDKKPAENKAAENKAADENRQADLVEVYDGRKFGEENEKEASSADTKFVANEFKNSTESIKKAFGDNYCSDSADTEVTIYNSVEGAFTKPNSKQKAYVYSICELGRGFGAGGILIAENETVVAHYVGQIGWSARLATLPDINKNGVLEITYADGGGGQGYTSTTIEILEFKDGTFKSLGDSETYSDNSGAVEDDAKAETTAYKISVEPSATPVFFREIYEKKGTAKNWSLAKKSEKFTLDKGNSSKFTKID